MPNSPRDPLSETLQHWRVQPPPNCNFRDSVWQRIDRRARLTWSGYLHGHLVGWSVTAMMALIAAGWGGHVMAQARLDAERDAMVVSYLSGLDPRVLTKLRP
jgi:hypothetical protein